MIIPSVIIKQGDGKDILYRILAKRTGQSEEKIAKDCSRDCFFSPDGALAYGLVDVVRREDS